MRTKTRRAFTLIELLVVIAIIAILAAILFPVFAKAREKAEQTQCISNVKQVSLGVLMYTEDYDSKFPSAPAGLEGWGPMINPYTKNDQILKCPVVDTDTGVDFAINGNLLGGAIATGFTGAKRGRIPTPAGTVLLFDAANSQLGGFWLPNPTAAAVQGGTIVRFSHLGDETAKDGMASIAFCDGHAKSQKLGDVDKATNVLPWARK